jgi:hypothetical protein
MCPACIATVAMIAGTTSGTGGLTALVVRKFGAKFGAKIVTERNNSKESHDGKQPDKVTTT